MRPIKKAWADTILDLLPNASIKNFGEPGIGVFVQSKGKRKPYLTKIAGKISP